MITKAWHAAGIFRKPVEEFSFEREVLIQYHNVDMEKAKKIRVYNEENRSRLKAFSENLVHSNKNDMPRVFPNPKRLKTNDGLTQGQIEWFKKHREEMIDNPIEWCEKPGCGVKNQGATAQNRSKYDRQVMQI